MYDKELAAYNNEINNISKYPKGTNIELEIRYKPKRDNFIKFVDFIMGKQYKVTQTLDAIQTNGRGNDIRKISFENGKKISEMYQRKTRIVKYDYNVYSVGVSREEPLKTANITSGSLLRFKYRVSFTEDNFQYDATAVYQHAGGDLPKIRDMLFGGDIYKMIQHPGVIYEAEAEFIGKNITQDSIGHAAERLRQMLGLPDSKKSNIYSTIASLYTSPERFKNGTAGIKQLGQPVISITKNTFYQKYYPLDNWYVTEKIDGVHAFIVCGNGEAYLVTKDIVKICDTKLTLVIEGELLDNIFHVFECLQNNQNITSKPFSYRLSQFPNIQLGDIKIVPKIFVKIQNPEKDITALYNKQRDYPIDGLVFCDDAKYDKTRWIKWKPADMQTIDFLARECPSILLGKSPFLKTDKKLYILFVGINKFYHSKLGIGYVPQYDSIFPNAPSEYYPIQFSPSLNRYAYIYYSDKDLDGKIIELSVKDDNWEFHRIRTDREGDPVMFGNDYRVAETIYTNTVDKFELSDLWAPQIGYFTKSADNMYKAPNRYKRFVIGKVMDNILQDAKVAVDIASGRGADLSRYINSSIEEILFMDIDPTAIAELIRRRSDMILDMQKRGGRDNINMHTMVADLKTDYKIILDRVSKFSMPLADAVICNFAIHYLCDSLKNIKNVLSIAKGMLKKGGVFMFTTMDGESVFKLLANYKTGDTWRLMENNISKYAIQKQYTGDTLAPYGQKIKVQLPLADEMYEEPLCSVDYFIKEATNMGFSLEIHDNFSRYFDSFNEQKLTKDDMLYISLHIVVTLRLV